MSVSPSADVSVSPSADVSVSPSVEIKKAAAALDSPCKVGIDAAGSDNVDFKYVLASSEDVGATGTADASVVVSRVGSGAWGVGSGAARSGDSGEIGVVVTREGYRTAGATLSGALAYTIAY